MDSTSNPGSVLDDKLDALEVRTEYSWLMAFSEIATLPTKKSIKLLLPIKLDIPTKNMHAKQKMPAKT